MPSHSCASPVGITSPDQLHSILSTECTSHVVQYFQNSTDNVASLDAIAAHVTSQRDDTEYSDPDTVRMQLHHASLPRLAEVGVVDYDPRHHTVRYMGHPMVDEHYAHLVETTD